MSFLKKWKGTALGAIAAPFTGGLSLAAGYMYDSVKQQNEANKKAVDRANAYDLYTWDLANQYNDPKAQMQRLAAAGLNPNLVYGSGSVTGNTTSTAGSNGVASQEGIAGGVLAKGLPLAQGLANLRNTNTQNELLKYQQELINEQIHNQPGIRRRQYLDNLALAHNIEYARANKIPVNRIPDWDSGFDSALNRLFNKGYEQIFE